MAERRGNRMRWAPLAALVLTALAGPAPGLVSSEEEPARSLDDARLRRLREASASWSLRQGPRREVVDVVCLVPDAASFFEAIGAWDESHWFPILIEDVEYTSKFLRAFRPSRIIRYPGRARPVRGEARWQAAIGAVGRAWTAADLTNHPGDRRPPPSIRRPPPGVVVSNPGSSSLVGAAALAAGRFQPLIRWEPNRGFNDVPTEAEAQAIARSLEELIDRGIPNYDRLGDDCDFLTLALDLPYRYNASAVKDGGLAAEAGPAALDDLIGRHLDVPRDAVRIRWAYTGRLLGDDVRSAYAAMCSLFLRPGQAALFNGYGEGAGRPFAWYRQAPAADRLGEVLEVARRPGDSEDLGAWHKAFAPVNRAGLVLLNSSGGPDFFNLSGPIRGETWDVPITEPAAVVMVHSFSAANPRDVGTIAGRWLANGAFAYFGSAHEPYLQSFRTPELVADLLARGLPIGAATRMMAEEATPFGNCWRLAYLGDPLFRVDPEPARARVEDWVVLSGWPAYDVPEVPPASADPFAVLTWAIRVAFDAARRGEAPPDALVDRVRAIDPAAVEPALRDLRDLLLADAFARRNQLDAFRFALAGRPVESLSPAARRWLDAARVQSIQRALAADDWDRAAALWAEATAASPPPAMLKALIDRVRPPDGQADRRASWRGRLVAARQRLAADGARAAVIDAELARLGPG